MATVPGVPLIQRRPGVTSQTLEYMWSPPLSDGGSPITSYTLTDGTLTFTLDPETRIYVVNGLTNGVAYSFRLAANNAIGQGTFAFFRTVQPGNKPDPPTSVSISSLVSINSGSYRVSWTNPSNTGGTTGLLGNVVKFYPVTSAGDVLSNSPSTIRKSVFGAAPGQPLTTFVNLSTTYNWKGQVFAVNDPGYSLSNFGLTSTTNHLYASGLQTDVYSGYFGDVPTWFATATKTFSTSVTNFTNIGTATNSNKLPNAQDNYSVQWTGFFLPPATGSYTFYTSSDDGSFVWIGPSAVSGFTTANAIVNNGGLHGMQERSGTSTLTSNVYYPIRIQFGEQGGGDDLNFSIAGPSLTRRYELSTLVFYLPG